MRITDWPADERPREKLLHHGAVALSDAELLAIFLRVGVTGCSAVDLARLLLAEFGSLGRLFAATRQEVSRVKGLGDAKYAQLQAVLEMARRTLAEELKEQPRLGSPRETERYLMLQLRNLPVEAIYGVFLDSQHRVIALEELARGTLSQSHLYPREVAKRALALNAAALIIAHNHPSGSPVASAADRDLTERLKNTLWLLDIKLLDHLLVAGHRAISFAEEGWV